MTLLGKRVLVTGAARRVGRALALAIAQAGGNLVLHHAHSPGEARQAQLEAQGLGVQAQVLQADLGDLQQVADLLERAWQDGPLFALVNSAAIFEPLTWQTTDLPAWQRHLDLNLTAPFLLSQAFARALPSGEQGRIINILDWRALRPGPDHLPCTISKAGLAALTAALAQALAPHITNVCQPLTTFHGLEGFSPHQGAQD